MIVVKSIERNAAFAPVTHETHLSQGPQGVRDDRLRHVENRCEVANAKLLLRQSVGDAETGRVPQHRESFGQ